MLYLKKEIGKCQLAIVRETQDGKSHLVSVLGFGINEEVYVDHGSIEEGVYSDVTLHVKCYARGKHSMSIEITGEKIDG